jgi:hypothetical protein
MKRLILCGCLAMATLLVGCAKDDKQAAAATGGAAGPKPGHFEQQTQTITATVEAVDPQTRMVTLGGEDGGAMRFRAGEHVRNLERVKVGDRVALDYYESVAIQVQPPGDAVNEVRTASESAKPGETPGGTVGQHTTRTATVERLDKKNSTATLRGPGGKVQTISVRDPKNLQNVNVGDRVVITYTERLAVAVRPAPASP